MSDHKDVERARKAAEEYWGKAWAAAQSDKPELMEAAFLRVIENERERHTYKSQLPDEPEAK